MIRTSRSVVVPCKCSGSIDPKSVVQVMRKKFENKRTVVAKQNLNSILAIATADLKDCTAVLKELDEFHKNKWSSVFKKEGVEETAAPSSEEASKDTNIFVD